METAILPSMDDRRITPLSSAPSTPLLSPVTPQAPSPMLQPVSHGTSSSTAPPPPPPLWQELVGLTMELGMLRRDTQQEIQDLRGELQRFKSHTEIPLQATASLQAHQQVLQEELSVALRTISSQQVEIEALKKTLKNEARSKAKKEENMKDDIAQKENRLQEIKEVIESYHFTAKDDTEKIKNRAVLALKKVEQVTEEVNKLQNNMEPSIRSEVQTQWRKVSAHSDPNNKLIVQQVKKAVAEEVEKKIEKRESESSLSTRANTTFYQTKSNSSARSVPEMIHSRSSGSLASHDHLTTVLQEIGGLVATCHEEVDSVRNDLGYFKQSVEQHQGNMVSSVSNLESNVTDCSVRCKESFAQIDLLNSVIEDVRTDVGRQIGVVREKVQDLNCVVEGQLDGLGILVSELGSGNIAASLHERLG